MNEAEQTGVTAPAINNGGSIFRGVDILLAPTLELARTVDADVTVEAEYGSHVVEGRVCTAAHHQKRGPYSPEESPAPCNDLRLDRLTAKHAVRTILVSHVDLDTLGGIARTLALGDPWFSDEHAGFWRLAEHVDLHGPHRILDGLALDGVTARHVDQIRGFWAWSRAHPLRPDRESVTNVTGYVWTAAQSLAFMLLGTSDWLDEGRKMAEEEAALGQRSLTDVTEVDAGKGGRYVVAVRQAPVWTNHLYALDDGEYADVIVGYNTDRKTITLSSEREIPGFSCRDVMQAVFGPEAGGRDTVAGGPRGKALAEADVDAVWEAACARLLGVEGGEE